mgnify:FL=1
MESEMRKKGLCGICPAGCGVEIIMKEEKLHRLKPMKGHPLGIVCVRGSHAEEVVYSPDRLKYPLKRTAPRGTASWQRITWQEAYEGAAHLIRNVVTRYGPESMAIYSGRGGFEQSLLDMYGTGGYDPICLNLLFPLGSPNTFSCSSLCNNSHRAIAPLATMGAPLDRLFPDLEGSDLIVVWGANPATDSPPANLRRLIEAKRRGATVVVIDPLKTYTAEKADRWIPIRPGTDGALTLGMAHVMIERGIYDRDFVEHWVHGFEEFKAYVRNFPPERVEAVTWVEFATVWAEVEDVLPSRAERLADRIVIANRPAGP